MNNTHDKLTKFYANNIVHQTPDNKHNIGIPNAGATGHYLQSDVTHLPSTNMGQPIYVGWPNDQTILINRR